MKALLYVGDRPQFVKVDVSKNIVTENIRC